MNQKSAKDRAKIVQLLIEGNSLRSTSRIADCSLTTVLKLLTDIGPACAEYQEKVLVNLPCKRIEIDEIWSFVHAKNKNVQYGMEDYAGDLWTFTSICPDTKIVPAWRVGTRTAQTAKEFVADLASRMSGKIQLTSDGFPAYRDAIEDSFGANIDYAVLYKMYDLNANRYLGAKKISQIGIPDKTSSTTAHVERNNLNMRMGMRRFTRKTNGFSKSVANHVHAVDLHFFHHNFSRIHKSLRVTPAIAAGIADKLWSIEDIVALID